MLYIRSSSTRIDDEDERSDRLFVMIIRSSKLAINSRSAFLNLSDGRMVWALVLCFVSLFFGSIEEEKKEKQRTWAL